MKALIVLVSTAMLAGCFGLSVRGGFSPVQGPLAAHVPVPTYPATMTGLTSGTISVTLENGEVCTGPWAFVSTDGSAPRTPAPGAQPTSDLRADWDAVYGTGYFVAHVLGNRLYARATLSGNRGSVVRAEFSNERQERGQTKGVARDANGNVFKVSVYN